MNPLLPQLRRLFLHPQHLPVAEDGLPERIGLVGPDGGVRTLVLGLAASLGWETVAQVCAGVQEDLALPLPVLAVSPRAGFQLWFSLAEAVPLAQARAFLEGLRGRYLAGLPAERLTLLPDGTATGVEGVPALEAGSGRWSAFVDPSMGGMFGTETWLEMAPGLDRQAEVLAGFVSIGAADFARALESLKLTPEAGAGSGAAPAGPAAPDETPPPPRPVGHLAVGSGFADPRSFLLAVMNDVSASAEQRIEAAKALLPYFERDL